MTFGRLARGHVVAILTTIFAHTLRLSTWGSAWHGSTFYHVDELVLLHRLCSLVSLPIDGVVNPELQFVIQKLHALTCEIEQLPVKAKNFG